MNKIKKDILFILFLFLNIFIFKVGFCYATNKPVGIFGDWTAFQTIKDNKTFCYIVSVPKKRYDNLNKRGESFFTIIKEYKNSDLEIYLSFGYISKKKIKLSEIDITKRKFPLFTYEDKAWTYNIEDDKNIINELKKSVIFNVSIVYDNNKNLMDAYSLNGFNEAYNKLLTMCE